MRTTNGGDDNVSILGCCRSTGKGCCLVQEAIRQNRRVSKLSLLSLLLTTVSANAGTVVIEAVGPNVPGTKVFTCERIESNELYLDATKGGWRIVPKTTRRVEPCAAGIYPSRNYHIYIRMDVYDNANNLVKTYKLPPYFAFINPYDMPQPVPEPPVLQLVYNSNKIKDLAIL